MDWWTSLNSSSSASSSPCANGATNDDGQSVADQIGIFDPWLNCDDLDLGTILHHQPAATTGNATSTHNPAPSSNASGFGTIPAICTNIQQNLDRLEAPINHNPYHQLDNQLHNNHHKQQQHQPLSSGGARGASNNQQDSSVNSSTLIGLVDVDIRTLNDNQVPRNSSCSSSLVGATTLLESPMSSYATSKTIIRLNNCLTNKHSSISQLIANNNNMNQNSISSTSSSSSLAAQFSNSNESHYHQQSLVTHKIGVNRLLDQQQAATNSITGHSKDNHNSESILNFASSPRSSSIELSPSSSSNNNNSSNNQSSYLTSPNSTTSSPTNLLIQPNGSDCSFYSNNSNSNNNNNNNNNQHHPATSGAKPIILLQNQRQPINQTDRYVTMNGNCCRTNNHGGQQSCRQQVYNNNNNNNNNALNDADSRSNLENLIQQCDANNIISQQQQQQQQHSHQQPFNGSSDELSESQDIFPNNIRQQTTPPDVSTTSPGSINEIVVVGGRGGGTSDNFNTSSVFMQAPPSLKIMASGESSPLTKTQTRIFARPTTDSSSSSSSLKSTTKTRANTNHHHHHPTRSLNINNNNNNNNNKNRNNNSNSNVSGQKSRRCRNITDYVLADEEKRLLIREGYSDFPMSCQARQLTKSEEKILRKIRRKIRNKKSAQCSRQRKKEYVEDLERKYAAVIRENEELKQLINKIQDQQQQHQHQQSQQQQQQQQPQQHQHSHQSYNNQAQQQQEQFESDDPIELDWKDLFSSNVRVVEETNVYN